MPLSPHPMPLPPQLINVYLMQQPTDYHSLPVWRRFLLGALFAECLYLHLAYFFSCMCALNVVLFADAVEAWPEPFNRPFAATSPVSHSRDRPAAHVPSDQTGRGQDRPRGL